MRAKKPATTSFSELVRRTAVRAVIFVLLPSLFGSALIARTASHQGNLDTTRTPRARVADEPSGRAKSPARTAESATTDPSGDAAAYDELSSSETLLDAPDAPEVVEVPKPSVPPVAVPTSGPPKYVVDEGAGFCGGVNDMIERSRGERKAAAADAMQGSEAGRLGQYIVIDSPFDGWVLASSGEGTRFDAVNSPRQSRETGAMLDEHGFGGEYGRGWQGRDSWQSDAGGYASFMVQEFKSTADAIAFDEESVRRACQDAKNTFTIPDVPGAMGLSLRGSAPPVDEEITFVRGPRRYIVTLSLRHHSDYQGIARMASLENEVAR